MRNERDTSENGLTCDQNVYTYLFITWEIRKEKFFKFSRLPRHYHNQITRDYVQAPVKPVKPLTSSRTLDSLVELQSTKINTPSMSSSGYGSQAVSTTNLTSEDSISVKSISVDETPDLEYRNLLDTKKPERMDSSLVEETPEEYMGEVTNALGNLNVMENTCGEG